MTRRLRRPLTAAVLAAALTLPLSAQALTPEQAGELLQSYYVDPVPQSVLDQDTIDGMLDALGDPYTYYFTPEEYADFTASLSDPKVVGIGVVCRYSPLGPQITQVLEGSPAHRGGLRAGDIITQADGVSLGGLSLEEAVALLRGEIGASVRVTYQREDTEAQVTLERDTITVATTTTTLLDGHIGYIDCDRFGQEAGQHFREGIQALDGQVNAWIVDLRDNSGGYTQAAAETAACFAGPGTTAYLRDGQDQYSSLSSQSESLTLYPVIVLVNENSASASELFANSIRDRGAGIVVGERTFGKGVVQTVLDRTTMPDYFPEGDGIKITSHRFFSPHGNTNDKLGVIPNVLVEEGAALDAARLLAGPDPAGDTEGILRVDLDWRWYIDLDQAMSQELRPVLQALLSALPFGTTVHMGLGGPDGWETMSPLGAAERLQLELAPQGFADHLDSPYSEALDLLKTYGLIHGDEAGLFHPQDSMSRAELAQMIANLLDAMDPAAACPFVDVPDDAWYRTAVSSIAKLGLINGVGGDRFDPEGTVSHQQFITILGRLSAWLNLSFYNSMAKLDPEQTAMPELAAYADWAKPWAWLLSYSQKNLLGGTISMLWTTADQIDPQGITQRDEAAYAICRMLTLAEIVPS